MIPHVQPLTRWELTAMAWLPVVCTLALIWAGMWALVLWVSRGTVRIDEMFDIDAVRRDE